MKPFPYCCSKCIFLTGRQRIIWKLCKCSRGISRTIPSPGDGFKEPARDTDTQAATGLNCNVRRLQRQHPLFTFATGHRFCLPLLWPWASCVLVFVPIDWQLAIINGISANLHCQFVSLPAGLPFSVFHFNCALQLTLMNRNYVLHSASQVADYYGVAMDPVRLGIDANSRSLHKKPIREIIKA